MFLRRLTIRGFKSFADKTALEFAPGISVIVGPNGSGKSNIVDAVAWVLGEQGPRALRGGQMTDVIFVGSPARQPAAMAEVRLVIDNSAGLIAVPADEIEITRSVLRSGESEYRLGGRPCRLLDIQELLSDTGVGRALHTIVSQGHLDDVLSSRPEERRQFIEEAAGIAKHRRRRERAERKLAGLDVDLNRLQDVVAELRRQLRPLRQQADLAERHEALQAEAATLARKLAAARLRDLLSEREGSRPRWEQAERERAEARQALSALDAVIVARDVERERAESMARRAEELQASAMQARARAEETLRKAIRVEVVIRDRLSAAMGRSGRLFALEEELERTQAALEGVRTALIEREAELTAAEETYRRAERARRDAEEERRRRTDEAAARRIETEALHRALEGHAAETERLHATLADLHAGIERLSARAGELEEQIERLDGEAAPLGPRVAELRAERSLLATLASELQASEKGLRARQDVIDAHGRDLEESPGAAFLRRRGHRAIGLLRDLLGTPPHLASAVRGALGSFADAVVYARLDEAMGDASIESASGVTLTVAGDAHDSGPVSVAGERLLLDHLRPDERVRALAGQLLAGTHLVRNLAEASAKHRAHPEASFVTPQGAVVGPAFVRVAYGHDARVEENRRQSAALERELTAVRRQLREGRQRQDEILAEEEAVAAQLEGSDRRITAVADEMSGVESELASLRREEQLVAERLAAVEVSARAARDRLASMPPAPTAEPPLPEAAEPPIAVRIDVEALRRDRDRLEGGVAHARAEIERLRAEDPVALRAELEEAQHHRAQADEALQDAEGNLAGAVMAHRAWTNRDRAARSTHTDANRRWREQAAEIDRLREKHEEVDRRRADLDRRIADVERTLREGHGTEPEDALEDLAAHDTAEDLQRRAEVVGRRLELLGRVNLLAAGDLEPLQERHDFIVRELEDVRAARRDLLELMAGIDRRMRELFETAFRDVAAEFALLFAQLFPGGEGRLVLTDPDDPLGSGIEVEARPGRKRVKRLSLLSGGERSLAALAFLFAIFRARPSPFYLLDEVEAALDDVNLHRFLEAVQRFSERSQLLIVSHQKRTMEMADVLYGVSMGTEGASAVIAQRLAEVPAR